MKASLRLVLVFIATMGLMQDLLRADSNKDREAKDLIEHARHLSDIRSQGAPAFQLKSKLRFLDAKTPVEGSYVEEWAAPNQWRTEIVKGGQSRLSVVNGRRYWFRGDKQAPHRRAPLALGGEDGGFRINRFEGFWQPWKSIGKIRDRESGIAMRCIESGSDGDGKSELCFAKDTGELAVAVKPLKVGNRWVDATCIYTNYQRSLGKSVPGTIRCFEEKKLVYEENFEELVPLTDAKPDLFQPLRDAEESTYCYSIPTPPRLVKSRDPEPPKAGTGLQQVVLVILVGTDGVPHNMRVQRSASDADFTQEAVAAVQQWRFRPAQCDGEVFEAQINVEVNSQMQ